MDFFKTLEQIDKTRNNVAITILSGKNIDSRILLSDGQVVFTNNNSLDWGPIIKAIPENHKSQTITLEDERIYFEFIRQTYRVVVCGAGHISIPIIKMCKLLELPVTVIDDRITFTNNALNAGADKVICQPFDKALDQIQGDSGSFFVIVTRGHRYDQICLEKIIDKENAYIGMIGSKLRVSKVLDYLEDKGKDREKLNRVYTPIGLKIGSETPAEIAVSIMAQIIEVKNKKNGSSTFSKELLDSILGEKYKDIPKALVTIVSRKGSAPREVGTKMIVLKDGTMVGTIGGGCVEADIRQNALASIESNKSTLVHSDMTGLEAEEEGMVCGGIIDLFIEPLKA